jgi:hypothetical protein
MEWEPVMERSLKFKRAFDAVSHMYFEIWKELQKTAKQMTSLCFLSPNPLFGQPQPALVIVSRIFRLILSQYCHHHHHVPVIWSKYLDLPLCAYCKPLSWCWRLQPLEQSLLIFLKCETPLKSSCKSSCGSFEFSCSIAQMCGQLVQCSAEADVE